MLFGASLLYFDNGRTRGIGPESRLPKKTKKKTGKTLVFITYRRYLTLGV